MESTEFKVSVIIPVYNAEKYLTKAVEAALSQEEVAEIILVEDASPDNSLELCRDLERQHPKVTAYQHPDKKNHGSGASRNYGLTKAKYDYVTFADADNYLLPNRYKEDKRVFLEDPTVDGVYNSMGIFYYTESAKKKFIDTVNMELLTFTGVVEPEEVLSVLVGEHKTVTGSWGIDGLTLKKELFNKTGLFNTKLKLQQDVDLYLKMSMSGKLRPGNITEPVCVRGVHDLQRSTDMVAMSHFANERWKSVASWLKSKSHISQAHRQLFRTKFMYFQIMNLKGLKPKTLFLKYVLENPVSIKQNFGYFDQNFLNAFGRNWLTLHTISVKNKILKTKKSPL